MNAFKPTARFLHTLSLLLLCVYCALQVQAEPATALQRSHAIAMHGQPKYAADFQHFDYTNPDAPKGGLLKLGVQGNFDSLNPFVAKGNAADQLGLIYDSLTTGSGDEAFSRYGLLAERIEWPQDRSWVIYQLRQEARFHDGHPIQASDVVFNFELLLAQGSPIYRSMYAQVEKVEALDAQRVKFSFKAGVNRELALIVGELPVLPEHFWASRDFANAATEIPLGSGPYRIASVDLGRNIVYQRNPDYWGRDLAVNRGLYNFDRIQLDYYKDAVVLLEALKAGQFDVRVENFSKQWATGYSGPAIEQGMLIKEEIRHQNPTGMQAFMMNLRNPLFQDRRVRQALTYAFDFEWSNAQLFYNAYTRTESFFSNSELASSGLPTAEELALLSPFRAQLPAELFSQPFALPQSDASGHNRQNLRAAKRLLDSAGWQVIDNRLRNAQGQLFAFEILLVSPAFERIVNPYAQALKKLGIEVQVRIIEPSQYINRLRSFDFDMIVGNVGQSLSPGNEQIDYWHSSTADQPGSRNWMGISNPVVDALIEQVIKAGDREQLISATRALDRVLLNQYYCIPQWHIRSHRLAYWNKFGRPAQAPKYDPGFNLGLLTWWQDEQKARALDNYRQGIH